MVSDRLLANDANETVRLVGGATAAEGRASRFSTMERGERCATIRGISTTRASSVASSASSTPKRCASAAEAACRSSATTCAYGSTIARAAATNDASRTARSPAGERRIAITAKTRESFAVSVGK